MSMEENTTKQLLANIISNFSYHLIGEAERNTRQGVTQVIINDLEYIKKAGRFGEVFVVDVYYASNAGSHRTKVAIKFIENASDALLEIKNTVNLEKKFSARSVVKIPRFIYANIGPNPFIAYEGITGINYEEAINVQEKSFWAGYVLAIIHEGQIRPVIYDVYEEIFRRLVMAIYAGEEKEAEIMQQSKNLLHMVESSQGGCDAFGDFHQSNLMLRTTSEGQIISIALIDPTFFMKGSYDRWEDVGTFFGRQSVVEFRETRSLVNTTKDINKFILGYNVHLREINAPTLQELYPKGFPIDFYIAIWGMMDYIEKTMNANIPKDHPDLVVLKELIYILLTKQPISKKL